jgi:hypothetical protein
VRVEGDEGVAGRTQVRDEVMADEAARAGHECSHATAPVRPGSRSRNATRYAST